MAFKLRKTKTFVHPCVLVQYDEKGNPVTGTLRVRFNSYTREEWEALTTSDDDDERLLYDALVNKIEDKVLDDDDKELSDDDALKAIRTNLSVTGQIVTQGMEQLFGAAAAKNARRSRAR
jgi:hypothetical protein